MKTIAIYTNKGGVAKTTSAVSIASTLCTMGNKCLVVDMDAQGCLGELLLHDDPDQIWHLMTIDRVLQEKLPLIDTVSITAFKYWDRESRTYPELRLDVLPSSPDLALYDFSDMNEVRDLLATVDKEYDYCFLDMPPANSDITYVGLCASDYLLTPFKADRFSASAIDHVQVIYEKILNFNPSLKFIGAFITDCDDRFKVSKWIKQNYDENDLFFKSYVRHSSCFDEANLFGKPIVCMTGSKGAEDYLNVTNELLTRMGDK